MNRAKQTKLLSVVVATVVVLMPLHALVTTFLASHFGHFDIWRIWKDIVIAVVCLVTLPLVDWGEEAIRWLRYTNLARLMTIYVLLFVLLGLSALLGGRVNGSALVYSLLSNLRFIGFFVVSYYLASQTPWLRTHWLKFVLAPAAVVVGFGLLQHFVLPNDFLRHVGYGSKTIPAYQTVDQKSNYVRLQSTLRGPNPLGAYLVIVLSVVVAVGLRVKKSQLFWAARLVATLIVLFFTYSRSAWLGAILAILIILGKYYKQQLTRRRLVAVGAATVSVFIALTFGLRHNDRFQNTFFHTDEHSTSRDSSNADRTSALKSGLKDLWHQPWGGGPGTAGPASVRSNHGVRLAENYFIQIGQEIGILGMLVFVAINILVAAALWRQTDDLSVALAASLVGLSLINMLSHAWADDSLSLVWWGLAGIALARSPKPAILNKKRKHHAKQAVVQN